MFNDRENKILNVMNAIYKSGIPISFKGSMVLKTFLTNMGYNETTRHTKDVDANWNTDFNPTLEQLTESIQKVIDEQNISFNVEPFRMYGEGKSAGFNFVDTETGILEFSMDMDVNRVSPNLKLYEIGNIKFNGVIPEQMLADKISAISTNRIFRRSKDLIDLFYLSHVFEIDKERVLKIIEESGRTLDNFEGFLSRKDDLIHAYERFSLEGDVYKPPFDEVYDKVYEYIKPFIADMNMDFSM